VLWGSYSPALKIAFSGAQAPDPATLTFLKNVISAGTLHLVGLLSAALGPRHRPLTRPAPRAGGKPSADENDTSTSAAAAAAAASGSNEPGEKAAAAEPPLSPLRATARRLLGGTSTNLWVAGLELGFWTFGGGALQAVGLASECTVNVLLPLAHSLSLSLPDLLISDPSLPFQSLSRPTPCTLSHTPADTTASRGGFLIQTLSVLTPLLVRSYIVSLNIISHQHARPNPPSPSGRSQPPLHHCT
jgi:hypothetical protein